MNKNVFKTADISKEEIEAILAKSKVINDNVCY